jgi:hypothetical protein
MGIYAPFAFQNSGGFIVSDADAQTYINKVVEVGGTMTQAIANAVNTLFTSMKSDGLYTQTKLLYPMVGATPASHALNAKSVNEANKTITWYGRMDTSAGHSSAGCLPDGSSNCYGGIARSPSELIDNINDGYAVGAYQSAFTANSGFLIGVQNNATFTNPRYQLNLPFDSNNVYCGLGGAGPTIIGPTSTTATGFFLGSRNSATSLVLYKNGSSIATSASSITLANVQTEDIELFGLNGNGDLHIGTVSFVIMINALDATESSNLNTAVQAFQTSLGRNV